MFLKNIFEFFQLASIVRQIWQFIKVNFFFIKSSLTLAVLNSNMNKIKVYGTLADDATRCVHYQSPLDIIAIKFKCCNKYFPCYQCHEETADHAAQTWEKEEWDTKAILCGNCKTELTIKEYMESENVCPNCRSAFNPNCSKHYYLYFKA